MTPSPLWERVFMIARCIAFILLFLSFISPSHAVEPPKSPGELSRLSVLTNSPRDTLRSFETAMNIYADAKRRGDLQAQESIRSAVECLNLQDVPRMNREHDGSETAIYLKEIIDRLYLIDYSKIPGQAEVEKEKMTRWELGDTGIAIVQVRDGSQKGDFLFHSSLVGRAGIFYEQIKDQPYLAGSGGGAAYEPPFILRYVPLWAKGKIFDIALWQWIGLLAALIGGLVVRAVTSWFLWLLKLLARKTKGEWDDRLVAVMTGPLGLIVSCGFWILSVKILQFSGVPLAVLQTVLQILFFAALTWLACRVADLIGAYLGLLASRTESTMDDQIVKLVARTLKLFAVLTGVVLACQNLGFNVVSLMAGLSIGGLAMALAFQNTLSNFIASIMIMVDQSFQVGHWIKIGETEGTVEEIGFRCTQIRTFYDSVVSIPNAEVMTSKIDNLGLRKYRRQLNSIGVTPDTAVDKIEAFVAGIKEIILANEFTRKDYFHVVLNDFGSSSLQIMIYFFLKVPDLTSELAQRQSVFLEIVRLAHSLEIRMAVPIQSIQIESEQIETMADSLVAPRSAI